MDKYGDVTVELGKDYVALMEIHRPPHNFFDDALIRNLADACETLDKDAGCRAIVLAAEGKSFCAGANFQSRPEQNPLNQSQTPSGSNPLYLEAVRLFRCQKPIVAAIQGPAIGGGLGLALVADFRVATPEARFAGNFVKIGIHPGFGLTFTLPRLIGQQRAALMLLTGRRIDGETAVAWGLADQLSTPEKLRDDARSLAAEMAENAPLAVVSTRATLRAKLADMVEAQTRHELAEQTRLMKTADHREGIKAVAERRAGNFVGR
ncbi:MAG TPA: enoyl-CoA hydratase/isomerase family protein [Candidatus Binataceae bacterium]|jgi:enoyl-CoA hydratase/carnithine racemase|nr:enoyl-CoA hydratase/isomerase family protein [Candidatus Binataceae bacterium]